MKYVWIDHKAYLSFDNLREYIETIFKKYGEDFIINFKSWKDDICDKKLLPYYNIN